MQALHVYKQPRCFGYRCPSCGKGFGRNGVGAHAKFDIEAKQLWRHVVMSHPMYLIEWFEKNRERWAYIRRKITRRVMTSKIHSEVFDLDVEFDLMGMSGMPEKIPGEWEIKVKCFFWEPKIIKLLSEKYAESKSILGRRRANGARLADAVEEIVDMLGSYWFKHIGMSVEELDKEVAMFFR